MSGATTPTIPKLGGKRPRVVLSKVMKYDVDHRKKSYRPERIDLHYDRLHNPDNCYHIRIDWMNVTAKLIEDAIKSWAAIATQHGLRLVEVPIAEACTISEVNPFRQPYHVKLAVPPPSKRPVTYYDPNSFVPQSQPGKHYYQKALLRKFEFVLDVEAASSFPSNVDVMYSWGKPDYKYTQYIHRSGIMLASITDEGDFLLIENRIYTNRAAAIQQPMARTEAPSNERVSRLIATGSYTSYGMAEPTPISSPMFRPVLFAKASRPAACDTSPGAGVTTGGKPGTSIGTSFAEHQNIRDELTAFCANEEALEAFYKETLEKSPVAATPRATPAFGAVPAHDAVPDAGIPILGLPPGVLGGGEPGASPRFGTPNHLSGSLLLRRGSVQQG